MIRKYTIIKTAFAFITLYTFSLLSSYAVPMAFAQFGTITNPLPAGSLGPGGGLIVLLNNILRLIFIVSGIYAFIQILIAGVSFISAGGDSKKITQAWYKIWQSLLGLAIVISSIVLAGLIGIIMFGRWDAILNPQVYSP